MVIFRTFIHFCYQIRFYVELNLNKILKLEKISDWVQFFLKLGLINLINNSVSGAGANIYFYRTTDITGQYSLKIRDLKRMGKAVIAGKIQIPVEYIPLVSRYFACNLIPEVCRRRGPRWGWASWGWWAGTPASGGSWRGRSQSCSTGGSLNRDNKLTFPYSHVQKTQC